MRMDFRWDEERFVYRRGDEEERNILRLFVQIGNLFFYKWKLNILEKYI